MEKVYSLWLIPTGEVYDKLSFLISRLSKQYSTPNFEPHVTLLSQTVGTEEEIIGKTSRLSKLIRPYKIDLGMVNYLDEYFKCLFVRVMKTKEVTEANLKTKEVFTRLSDPEYMPHLSLMYGDFTPTIKEEIIREIGKELNMSFEVKSIHLFFTGGEVNKWYKIKEFALE